MYKRKMQPALPGPDDTQRQTLPNGITVLARENFASPAVVVTGYLQAGTEDETPEQAGLAHFTTEVMERGTRNRSFEQLYEEIESVGASFGLGPSVHITSFGAKGLSEHLPLLLDILNDVLRNPAFPDEQVQHARCEILSDLQELAHDTRSLSALAFHELAYPEAHPYHRNLMGSPETVRNLTRNDLVAFHERRFSPQGMVVVVVGAIKAEQAIKTVAETFGNWNASSPERTPLPEVPSLTKILRKEITVPEKTQSDLVLGWPGPARSSPDFLACHLANTILGVFGMMGRLGERVRSQSGLAYYAYSGVDGGKGNGPWRAIAGVNPANVERATSLILDEIQAIRETRVPDDEIEDSKSYLTGSLPLRMETNEGVAQALIYIERNELGMDYLQRYRKLINDITAEEILAATQRWLDPDHYALAIAGPENATPA